ncbi:UvrD-helicase domain-containing protein [Actinomycetaceae bacterium L2_0104]
MAQVIMGPELDGRKQKRLDGSVRSSAYAFLEKLMQSDTSSGLHIEPIRGAADPRVRTGRVSDFYRAVLIKLEGSGTKTTYLYLGTYPHDDAIKYALTASVVINPISGVAELLKIQPPSHSSKDFSEITATVPSAPEPDPSHVVSSGPQYPVLGSRGFGVEALTGLGLRKDFAEKAIAARSEDELLALAEDAPAAWQGIAIVGLAAGQTLEQVRTELLTPVDDSTESDEKTTQPSEENVAALSSLSEKTSGSDDAVIQALQHPASQLEFVFVESDEDLRVAIEDQDFARWRVFLHPEQRRYVLRNRNGAFRLSGGAGTGKTVVLVHRAKHLAEADPHARVILTTYTRTLATALEESLQILDPNVLRAGHLGDAGVYVAGIDQLVFRILAMAKPDLAKPESPGARAVTAVFGRRSGGVDRIVPDHKLRGYWQEAIESVEELPLRLRSVDFIRAEYSLVVLPAWITDQAGYIRIRRTGRGVRLSRRERMAVWQVIAKYRALTAIDNVTDWDEKAAVAARYLDERVRDGVDRPATSVLVDEAQDLTPTRLVFLRALAPAGRNDLFLAEDSHQRIYGNKIVLSRYGIAIRGRSRRLTLNYRTTAENLQFALQILEGENPLASVDERLASLDCGEFDDMDGSAISSSGYRSARSGPEPILEVCESLTDELDKAAEWITNWIGDGVEPSSIGLLCYSIKSAETLTRGLMEREIKARYIDQETRERGRSKGRVPSKGVDSMVSEQNSEPVFVMTMHRAKGMEFSRVVLFDVHRDLERTTRGLLNRIPEEEHTEFLQRNRSLEYVAATRARDQLVVIRSR